jgi:hypothetical protein
VEKKRVGKNKEKIKKRYDKAKTPYQRVLESDNVSNAVKVKLKEIYVKLNPVELKRNIDKKLRKI